MCYVNVTTRSAVAASWRYAGDGGPEAMAVQVLAWRYDHVGDCNRYGNCVDHPFFERPALDELVAYPNELPNGAALLQYVPSDAISADGNASENSSAFEDMRRHAAVLRAAAGDALHQVQRGRVEESVQILENAITDFDRLWNFSRRDDERSGRET